MKNIFTVRANNGMYEFNWSHSRTRAEAEKALALAQKDYPHSAHIIEQQVASDFIVFDDGKVNEE